MRLSNLLLFGEVERQATHACFPLSSDAPAD